MNAYSFRALRLLADGEFRSGEAMAQTLHVSRATVWNARIGLARRRHAGDWYRIRPRFHDDKTRRRAREAGRRREHRKSRARSG